MQFDKLHDICNTKFYLGLEIYFILKENTIKKIQTSLFVLILASMNLRQVHAIDMKMLTTKFLTTCLVISTTNGAPDQTPSINPTNLPKQNPKGSRSEILLDHIRGRCPSCDTARDKKINPTTFNRIFRDMNQEFENNTKTSS